MVVSVLVVVIFKCQLHLAIVLLTNCQVFLDSSHFRSLVRTATGFLVEWITEPLMPQICDLTQTLPFCLVMMISVFTVHTDHHCSAATLHGPRVQVRLSSTAHKKPDYGCAREDEPIHVKSDNQFVPVAGE